MLYNNMLYNYTDSYRQYIILLYVVTMTCYDDCVLLIFHV